MRPAQCKTLVFAICLMSILKGLKKPPPASHMPILRLQCPFPTTTCPITISKGHVNQRCRALYEPESSHKKVDGTMARKWGNLQGRLC